MIGCCAKSGQFFYYKCNSHYKKGKDICDTPIKRIELQASEPRGTAFFTMTYSGTTSSTTLPNIQGVIIGPVGSGYYLGQAIAEGDVIKGVTAAGTWLMTISEITLSFDDADPFLRGQQNTFPGPGEITFKEMVTLDGVYLDEPMSGTDFGALTSWTYTRFTIDGTGVERTYAYSITDELVANLHWGGAHTLQTDAPTYGYGDIALITATIDGNDGRLLTGDEAYVSVTVAARPDLSDFVILTDDGQSADQIAGDGVYSGSMLIRPDWPLGDWLLILFAQENLFGFNEIGSLVLNSFPPGRPDFMFRHAILTVQ